MTVSNGELDRVREFYENQAQRNPRHAAVLGEPNDFATAYRERQELAVFREILPLNSQSRFIEFGSGGGRWLYAVAPTVQQSVGVEFSSRCVEISRQRLGEFDNVSIHQSAIQDFELEREFDVLYYSGVLLYLSDQEMIACIGKHLRHLSDDGCVLIRDSVSLTETHRLQHTQGYSATYRSISHWQQIMDDLGLKLATRVSANGRPVSNRIRNSKALQLAHRIARRCGLETRLMVMVCKVFGRDPAEIDSDPGYSHDFLLYRFDKLSRVRLR